MQVLCAHDEMAEGGGSGQEGEGREDRGGGEGGQLALIVLLQSVSIKQPMTVATVAKLIEGVKLEDVDVTQFLGQRDGVYPGDARHAP